MGHNSSFPFRKIFNKNHINLAQNHRIENNYNKRKRLFPIISGSLTESKLFSSEAWETNKADNIDNKEKSPSSLNENDILLQN